ncbi:MAG: magnesium transporter [Clostridia bacterium]|nr:magnesium transporter [Clostridia bacterium]
MDEKNFSSLEELLSEGKLMLLRRELSEWNEADVADFLESLDNDKIGKVFRILPKDMSADVFSYMEPEYQEKVVDAITDREVGALADDLFTDDAVDFLEEVPANVVTRVLRNASPETRKTINKFLSYPEDSAGSIMTDEMLTLHDSLTVGLAIDQIRSTGREKASVYTAYVIDGSRHLVGSIDLADLLFNSQESRISDVMDDDESLISVGTLDDQEDVAEIVKHYDLLSVPVVDKENRLVGIVTVDDVVDILEEEATEDIEKMAAITPSDKPYLRTGIWATYKKRMPWLLILMISATFTSMIITKFESALAAFVVLTAYIPMLMDTGGNAGSQASISVIRALSVGDVEFRDFFRVVWKEIRVAFFCGLTLAAANFVKLLLLDKIGVVTAAVICLTLLCVVCFAKLLGCTLPILADKAHLDPAVMASPLITTIVDSVSLLIYFALATSILHIG